MPSIPILHVSQPSRPVRANQAYSAFNSPCADAGVPVVYWVTAEPTVSLLGVCLPAMMPLGRHLMATYLSPLASLVSLALSSRGSRSRSQIQSKSGDSSGAVVEYETVQSSRRPKDFTGGSVVSYDGGNLDLQSLRSTHSQQSILHVSPHQDHHKVAIRAGESREQGSSTNIAS